MSTVAGRIPKDPGERVVRCYDSRGVYTVVVVGGVNSDQAAIVKAMRIAEGRFDVDRAEIIEG